MAIAGSTLEAFTINLVGDRLDCRDTGRISGHLVERDPAKALKILLQRKTVLLQKHGNNLAEIRRLYQEACHE